MVESGKGLGKAKDYLGQTHWRLSEGSLAARDLVA